jgi:acetolactate synthase-1/2/3 large subunit
MLLSAKKPVIYVGGGVVLANAAEQLFKRTTLNAPVTTTLMGLGAFSRIIPFLLGSLVCTVLTTLIWR